MFISSYEQGLPSILLRMRPLSGDACLEIHLVKVQMWGMVLHENDENQPLQARRPLTALGRGMVLHEIDEKQQPVQARRSLTALGPCHPGCVAL